MGSTSTRVIVAVLLKFGEILAISSERLILYDTNTHVRKGKNGDCVCMYVCTIRYCMSSFA